jgi:hypothetical protein
MIGVPPTGYEINITEVIMLCWLASSSPLVLPDHHLPSGIHQNNDMSVFSKFSNTIFNPKSIYCCIHSLTEYLWGDSAGPLYSMRGMNIPALRQVAYIFHEHHCCRAIIFSPPLIRHPIVSALFLESLWDGGIAISSTRLAFSMSSGLVQSCQSCTLVSVELGLPSNIFLGTYMLFSLVLFLGACVVWISLRFCDSSALVKFDHLPLPVAM